MNEELKLHALRIAEILQEQGNPYQRVEIDQSGIKIVSTDAFEPIKCSRHHKCFICGDPADLQLDDGQWECDNCSDIAADVSMEQERENND